MRLTTPSGLTRRFACETPRGSGVSATKRLPRMTAALLALALLAPAAALAEDVKVCVDVQLRQHGASKDATPLEEALDGGANIFIHPPRPFLKRLVEHHITHEPGFAAVKKSCDQRIDIELYPVGDGWTVFGRYSGHQREEKVDRVVYEELQKLAERLVLALLYDRPIEDTIRRTTVLEADSVEDIEQIRGKSHFAMQVGSTLALPLPGIDTATGSEQVVEETIRVLAPVNLQIGYRGNFRAWGVDAFARLGLGAGNKAPRNNVLGGHVDHTVDVRLGMNLLFYLTPDTVNSWYLGTGATFDLSWYEVIKPRAYADELVEDDLLFGGGLSATGIIGYEFLRTSGVRPMIQLELHAPAYIFSAENDFGAFNAWVPAASLMAGVMF
jgi:hypothetical protein